MNFRNLFCVTLGLILCITIIMAPRCEANPKWTGFYLGINSGGLINDSKGTLEPSGDFLIPPISASNPLRTDSMDFDRSAFTGGAQAGYNYQYKWLLVGLETDFNYSSLREKDFVSRNLAAPLIGTFTHTVKDKLLWFGTVRPRIGLTWKPLLMYATGGFSYGHIKSDTNAVFSAGGDTYIGSSSKTRTGWNVGGGVEGLLLKHWSLKLEYLFVDLGKLKYTDYEQTGFPTYTYTTRLENRYHIIRLGLNYHF
jgi:outer membrane immunogenic protein